MAEVGEVLHQTLSASKTVVEWQIKNFCEKESALYSIHFLFSNANWFLKITPMNDNWISLFLFRENGDEYFSKGEQKHCTVFSIGIKKFDGSVFKSFSGEHIFYDQDIACGKENLLTRSDILESRDVVLPDGTLTIFCDLQTENISSLATPESVETLSNSLKRLYLTERYTDLKIKVGDREFQAHKLILAARSPVFACMFEHEMKEKRSSSVEITDCDPDSFRDFLLYLYTGEMGDISCSNSVNLFKIAEKYGLTELKNKCSQNIKSELTVEMICDVIHLSVVYNEPALLKTATNFFIDNVDKILIGEKWLAFLKDNHLFANELLIKALRARPKIEPYIPLEPYIPIYR